MNHPTSYTAKYLKEYFCRTKVIILHLQSLLNLIMEPRKGINSGRLLSQDLVETISYDTWEIFKIMAELVNGFQKLTRIGPCVSIFGSARTDENDKYYKLTEEIGYLLTKSGFGIITGGGHGIMEAANKELILQRENLWD